MPPPKLSLETKLLRSRLKFVESLFNKARMEFSMRRLVTYRDLMICIGYSEGELEYCYLKEQLNASITFAQLKSEEANYKWRIEHNEWKTIEGEVGQGHEYEGYTYPPRINFEQHESSKNQSLFNEETNGSSKCDDSDKQKTEDNVSFDWQQFFTSPNQKASLRGEHQRSTARELYTAFHRDNKRAMLLEGGAGNGKTYVACAVVRKLLDDPTFFAECISPWPVLWITRASIVEQTSRVCRDDFGMCPHTECIVVNVEQLRARFGSYMVEDKTIVQGGEEHIIWTWKPRFHPMLFIVDECQLAKNDASTQAKIIAAIADIDSKERVHMIFMSATPFTRVSESRYFCINTHMEIKV